MRSHGDDRDLWIWGHITWLAVSMSQTLQSTGWIIRLQPKTNKTAVSFRSLYGGNRSLGAIAVLLMPRTFDKAQHATSTTKVPAMLHS